MLLNLLSFLIQYVLELFFFKFKTSFLNNLKIKPVGVTIKKKIIPITTGEIILPKILPIFIHSLFKGVSNFEFFIPNKRKIKDIAIAHILGSPLLLIGHKEIIRKTTKNNIPKLLFEGNLVLIFMFNILR